MPTLTVNRTLFPTTVLVSMVVSWFMFMVYCFFKSKELVIDEVLEEVDKLNVQTVHPQPPNVVEEDKKELLPVNVSSSPPEPITTQPVVVVPIQVQLPQPPPPPPPMFMAIPSPIRAISPPPLLPPLPPFTHITAASTKSKLSSLSVDTALSPHLYNHHDSHKKRPRTRSRARKNRAQSNPDDMPTTNTNTTTNITTPTAEEPHYYSTRGIVMHISPRSTKSENNRSSRASSMEIDLDLSSLDASSCSTRTKSLDQHPTTLFIGQKWTGDEWSLPATDSHNESEEAVSFVFSEEDDVAQPPVDLAFLDEQ